MCTVTYIPTTDKIFITSNRDESPHRRSKGLRTQHFPEGNIIHYPLDESSGGSWIALSDAGRVVCLLNGGFETFIYKPPYRQSRGQVVKDAILETDADQFLHNYLLEGIAPFTLLLFENDELYQLVWDGAHRHLQKQHADLPQIWSSVTLYPEMVRVQRKDAFEKWIAERDDFDRESVIQFHQYTNGDPQNDFIMNRNEIVKTLSITSVVLKENTTSLLHLELDTGLREEILLRND